MEPTIDSRGAEYGGALFNRTTHQRHKEIVQENFVKLMDAGLFERKTMQQYYEINSDGEGRFLPDRYVEGMLQNVVLMGHEETSAMNVGRHTNLSNY